MTRNIHFVFFRIDYPLKKKKKRTRESKYHSCFLLIVIVATNLIKYLGGKRIVSKTRYKDENNINENEHQNRIVLFADNFHRLGTGRLIARN